MDPVTCHHVEEYLSCHGTKAYLLIHSHFVTCIAKGSCDIKASNCHCYQCHAVRGRIHACLLCPCFGCFTRKHIHEHSEVRRHMLAVDIISGFVFCFHCQDYMSAPELEAIAKKNKIIEAKIYGLPLLCPWELSEADERKKRKRKGNAIVVNHRPGIRGLWNLANTCYLNCIIQVLTHTPFLREYFMSDKHECKLEAKDCMMCEVSHLYQQFYGGKDSIYYPCKALYLLWKETKGSIDQEDVLDIFRTVIELLCMHYKGKRSILISEITMDFFLCDCIFHELFSGLLLRDEICSNCLSVSSNTEPFFSLTLNLKTSIECINGLSLNSTETVKTGSRRSRNKPEYVHHKSLVECLKRFTSPCQIKKTCKSCGFQTVQEEQSTLKVVPNLICLHLNRYDSNNEKNTAQIQFDEIIDLEPFMWFSRSEHSKKVPDTANSRLPFSDFKYRLFSVVEHKGSVTGHYLCYVKVENDWYCCNDEKIGKVTVKRILESQGYLLFYHKQMVEFELDDECIKGK